MTAGVDGGDIGTFQIIKPTGTTDTNLCTNPSFELGTTGWTATSSTITQTAGAGVFGSYGGRLLASATGGYGVYTGASVANNTPVAISVWVKASSPLVNLYLDITTVGNHYDNIAHPGDGQWHRLYVANTIVVGGPVLILLIDLRSSAWTNVDIDGAQIETGVTAATTYIDGDQDGCNWTGTAHGSTSTRDGRDPRGGRIYSLASLGWTEKTWGGVGAPEVTAQTLTLALADGESFQQQVAKPRVITLSALATASNLAALHAARRSLIDVLTPDIRTGRGQIRLRYAGAATPKMIDVVNESGFGFDKPYHQRAEMAEMRFLAPDPIWTGEREESASLTASQTVSPVSVLAMRNTDGTWTSLGGGAAANVLGTVEIAEDMLDGKLVVAGSSIADLGGVSTADNLGVWDGSAFAVLGSAAPNGAVYCGAIGNDGTLYIFAAAATFTTVGGQTVNGAAKWNGSAWSVVGTGGLTGLQGFLSAVVDPSTGYVWAMGTSSGPTTAGGVTINGLGLWNGSAWSAISQTGLPASWGSSSFANQGMVAGPDGRIYIAVTSATTKGIYYWNGSSWTLFAAATGTSASVNALLMARGRLYAAGYFTALGGVTVSNIAELTSSGISSMAGGVTTSTAWGVSSLAYTPDGLVHAAGRDWTLVGGVSLPDSIASWNGSSWSPFLADPPNTGTHANDIYQVRSTRTGRLVVNWSAASGTFGTSMTVQAITSVTNSGSANAYPVVEFNGTGALYQIANRTTGQTISFNGCTVASGEIARLDLRPGKKTFAATLRNLITTVLPGSDLATFCLAPGANSIAVYAAGGTVTMHFKDRFWAAD